MLARERKLMTVKGKLPDKGLILNIGCGEFSYFSSVKGKVINCDCDIKKIPYFIQSRGEELPFKDRSFDNIVIMDVLEHIKNDELLIKETHRVLKKTGRVFITTSCKEDDFPLIEIPKKIDWKQAEKEWGHVRRGYTREEFRQLVKKNFEIFHLERFGATFSRIGYQLYYLRKWYRFWNYFPPVRFFLRLFNYLDFWFCKNKGHMIFAILSPKNFHIK